MLSEVGSSEGGFHAVEASLPSSHEPASHNEGRTTEVPHEPYACTLSLFGRDPINAKYKIYK